MVQAGAVEPRARERQHVGRQIDAEPALDRGAEQFQHAAGAGAEIEQRAHRLVAERVHDRPLHRVVGGVQFADAVPLRGMRAEIILRGFRARLAHGGQPFAVAGKTGSSGSRYADESRTISAPPSCSATRKKAQEPSRWRSISPASDSSLR